MRSHKIISRQIIIQTALIAFVAALSAGVLASAQMASAAALNQTLVRFDRMKVSSPTTGTVCAKPTTASTEASVQVTFPTGYTVSTTLSNWTVSTTNLAWPASGTVSAWPGIGTATAVSGQTVTFPSGDLTPTTSTFCFNWTNSAAISVKASATSNNTGTVVTRDSGTATIDSADYLTASITDDQIVVSASVQQTFSFALSDVTDNLGNLSTAAVSNSPTPRTVTVNTNAKNGWMVWARDANTGLNSASAAKTIASSTPGAGSPTTLVAGTEGYNLGVTQTQGGGTGVPVVAAGFVGAANTGGGLDTTLRTLVTSDGPAQNAVVTLTNNASIGSTTPAASDYTDVITVVGAGLF